MPKARTPLTPILTRTDDTKAARNDRRITQSLERLSPAATGVVVELTLAVGNNAVRPPMRSPQGAMVTYQSAAGTIASLGLDDDGNWVFNSTVACTARVSFH